MKKILFLDIDGVLNWVTYRADCKQGDVMNPYAIKRVKSLCESESLDIVLSSSWRHYPDLLKKVKNTFNIIDCTPTNLCTVMAGRGSYITAWLKLHPEVGNNYIILDDDTYDMSEHEGHIVQTFDFEGFTEAKLEEALNLMQNISNEQSKTP